MLKIIASVVLSLVTIMAVTLFAVTVPAQSQKIDENAAAIVKAQTDAETNAYNKVKEDILSDMSGSTLEDVGTAISALQDDVSDLENKKLYLHSIYFKYSDTIVRVNFYSNKTAYSNFSAFFNDLSTNVYILCESLSWRAFLKQSDTHLRILTISGGAYNESSYNSITNITNFSDITIRVY